MTQQYVGTKIVTAWEADKDGQPGYGVKYADGYTSWSPKGTFEAAYLPLGHIQHLPEYAQRAIAEQAELGARIEKLGAYLGTEAFYQLPDEERWGLMRQHTVMTEYAAALGARVDRMRAAAGTAG